MADGQGSGAGKIKERIHDRSPQGRMKLGLTDAALEDQTDLVLVLRVTHLLADGLE